jgi:hypothetical protein
MARCPADLLHDIADVLDDVRRWDGIEERRPNVFYLRRDPFLHFHLMEGGLRRADVKGLAGWHSVELPLPLPKTRRRALTRELRARYREKRSTPPGRR